MPPFFAECVRSGRLYPQDSVNPGPGIWPETNCIFCDFYILIVTVYRLLSTVHRKDVPRAFQGIFGSWTLVPGLLDQGLESETEYAITVTLCQKDAFRVITDNGELITVNNYY